MPRVAPLLSLAAAALFGSFLAGCGGSSASANGCGTHEYSYVGGGIGVVGGAPWYGGDYGGGWYDPGDDGTDYGDESAGAVNSGGSGSGDNGSGDDGSGDDGSSAGDDGSNSGDDSSDDGSGDDGSGDDGSGDDGTAAKKHLHLANAPLHTAGVTAATSHDACYAYSCDLLCAVGSPATQEREARGYSAISANDACETAAHGVETWAHDSLGSNVSACKPVTGDNVSSSNAATATRQPAAPSVSQGFSSGSSSTTRSIASVHAPR